MGARHRSRSCRSRPVAPKSWGKEDACGLCVELISGEMAPDPYGMDLKPMFATSLQEVEMPSILIPKDLKRPLQDRALWRESAVPNTKVLGLCYHAHL